MAGLDIEATWSGQQIKKQINLQQESLFESNKDLIKKELSSFIIRNLYAEEGPK